MSSPRIRAALRRGQTIIEVMVSLGLLAAIFLGFAASTSVTTAQREVARERLVALRALNEFIESKRALKIPELLALPAGDVPAVGTLDVSGGGLRNAAGLFVRVTDENPPISPTLSAADRNALGFLGGFDLNGDGDTADVAVPAEGLVVLPAKVALRWNSALGGQQEEALYVYFSDH